jgi:dGTPase
VVEKLENNGEGLNLTWEVRNGIVNHTGKSIAATLEGVIVKFADRIAYINHDIDDACRAGVLRIDDIPTRITRVLGKGHSERINNMVTSIVEASLDKPYIMMDDKVGRATDELRDFLFENVYRNPIAKGEESKAQELLIKLFEYYVKHPEKMPDHYSKNIEDEGVERCVCDFVSGMTDRYAIDTYQELFVPKVWRGR